jgi:hypothetical protein
MTESTLINTPLQRGGGVRDDWKNRFNGFPRATETVKTVAVRYRMLNTQLKQGVNEIGRFSD